MSMSRSTKMPKSVILSFLALVLGVLLGLLVLIAAPEKASAAPWDYTVTAEEGLKVHPGMQPTRVHHVLKERPIYADSASKRGVRYWVEVYNGTGWKEFGVVYRIRKDKSRVVVMTAWKNML